MIHLEARERARQIARLSLENLPSWLEEEIRTGCLSIFDSCEGGDETTECFQAHFPKSRVAGGPATQLAGVFDIVAISNGLDKFEDPWTVLRTLGAHAGRHLVVLVPLDDRSRSPGHIYRFDDVTVGTHIDPDFRLSSCRVVGTGAQLLLTYSRPSHFPHSQAVFDRNPAPPPRPEPRRPNPIESIIVPQLRRARTIAVVPCAIPFSSAQNQRPFSLAKHLADSGKTVLFVEVWECPGQAVHQTGEEVYPGIFTIPFYAFSSGISYTFQDNLEVIASASNIADKLYLCTIPLAGLLEAAGPLRAAGYHIHYDIMDDWEEFPHGDQEIAHWFSAGVERSMLTLSDSVSAVSDALAQKFHHLRPDIAVVRNGYEPSALDCDQFAAARAPLPARKTVGYFGHFADAWFDWETVFAAARERPDVQFELIGSGLSDRTFERLKSFPNIHLLGLIPQKNLHRYAEKWWAGMIPFAPSALSAAVDPLKIYEYLHFGLPTLVTGVSGICNYPLVHYVPDPREFVPALDKITRRPDEQTLRGTTEFLKTCVWEQRLRKLTRMTHHPAHHLPSMLKRICFAYVWATAGGVERVFLNRSETLLRHYPALEIEVYFYHDCGGIEVFQRYIRERNLHHRLRVAGTFNPERYDAVFAVDTPQIATDYPGVNDKLFMECHTHYPENRAYLQDWQHRLKTLIVPSSGFGHVLESECPQLRGKIRVLRNFVPQVPQAGDYPPLPSWCAPLFLYFGRIDEQKNFREFAEALGYARRYFRKELLGIISGPVVPGFPFAEVLEKNNLRGSVVVLPPVPFAKSHVFMAQLREKRAIFVSPSKGESFGLSVAEAMRAGLPVILSDIDSHATLVANREKFLYPLGEARSLANKMVTAMENYDELAAECVQLSEHFSEDTFLDDWEDLFQPQARVLSRAGKS